MYLDIPAKDFKYYRVVLIVTDIFNRRHLKDLANIILDRLGFSSIILHQVMLYILSLHYCKYHVINQLVDFILVLLKFEIYLNGVKCSLRMNFKIKTAAKTTFLINIYHIISDKFIFERQNKIN